MLQSDLFNLFPNFIGEVRVMFKGNKRSGAGCAKCGADGDCRLSCAEFDQLWRASRLQRPENDEQCIG